MSIASAIELKQQQVAQAYTAVSDKGGTLPATQNLSNLPTAITSIPSTQAVLVAKTFTDNGVYDASSYNADGFSRVTIDVSGSTLITKTITENGTYYAQIDGADGYSEVTVDISTLPYLRREISNSGVYQMPTEAFTYLPPEGVTDLGAYVLSRAFYGSTGLGEAYFFGLTSLTGEYALQEAFAYCINLTDISFPDLTTTSFGSSTNQFNNMLLGVTGCTVHFPTAIESTIDVWADVVAGFGGTNTTVLFDLTEASE